MISVLAERCPGRSHLLHGLEKRAIFLVPSRRKRRASHSRTSDFLDQYENMDEKPMSMSQVNAMSMSKVNTFAMSKVNKVNTMSMSKVNTIAMSKVNTCP